MKRRLTKCRGRGRGLWWRLAGAGRVLAALARRQMAQDKGLLSLSHLPPRHNHPQTRAQQSSGTPRLHLHTDTDRMLVSLVILPSGASAACQHPNPLCSPHLDPQHANAKCKRWSGLSTRAARDCACFSTMTSWSSFVRSGVGVLPGFTTVPQKLDMARGEAMCAVGADGRDKVRR